jgi:hypothetical protein
MEPDFTTISKILEGGGNLGLFVVAYIFNKASERLARIEKALANYMKEDMK